MAYGVKYKLEFSDVLAYEKKVEILKKDYSGSVKNMTGQAEPVIVKWNSQNDFYKPIIGSVCTLNLFITDSGDYDNFYEYDEREYQIKVSYKDVSNAWQTYWLGFIVVDRYREEFKAKPTAITLKAYDGLGTLNNYNAPLSTSSTYWNSVRIADILDNLGLDFDIWVQADIYASYSDDSGTYPYTPVVTSSRLIGRDISYGGQLGQLEKGADVPKCKDQLEAILKSYNCRIYQSYGRWYIVENSNIFDSNVKSSINSTLAGGGSVSGIRDDIKAQLVSASAETINTFKYNSSGTYQSTSQESILRICPTTLKNIGGDLIREYLEPFAQAKYKLETSQINKYFYNKNFGFEFGSGDYTINSSYATLVTNSNAAQGNAAFKLSSSAPSSGTTEVFRNTFTNNSGYWKAWHNGSAELSFFVDLIGSATPTITVQFSICAYSSAVSPNTVSWDDVNDTWGLDGSDFHIITRDFDVFNNWHTISVPMQGANISTATQFNVGIVIYNCLYSNSEIGDIYFDNVGVTGNFHSPPSLSYSEPITLPTKYIEYAENNSGNIYSKDYEQKGTYYFTGTEVTMWAFARTRDYGLTKTCIGSSLQNIMNDYRDFVARYEGTFRNQVVEPLTFNNRIWFNFGAIFQDDQSCYIDGLTYKIKSANAKVIAHLPNDDDDIDINLRITKE
tara:strand:- start:402 stop:2423 length:2022 start_codon:yes stop_codon:yes gene_type:complete